MASLVRSLRRLRYVEEAKHYSRVWAHARMRRTVMMMRAFPGPQPAPPSSSDMGDAACLYNARSRSKHGSAPRAPYLPGPFHFIHHDLAVCLH